MDSAAYDKVVIEGRYADELCQRFDMMDNATGSMLALMGFVSDFRFPLMRGTLLLEYGGTGDVIITFNLDDDRTGSGHYKMNSGIEWKVQGTKITLLSDPPNPADRKKVTEIAQYFTNVFKAVMQRMSRRKDEVVKEERRIPKVKKGKVKHGKKQKNRTVYVRQTVYKVSSPPPSPTIEEGEREKRDYERQTFRWTRAGHHRRLRNGEVRWFPEKEIVLDPDAVKESKTYKIKKGEGEQNDG